MISYLSDNVTQFIKYFVRITELLRSVLLIAFALDERDKEKNKYVFCEKKWIVEKWRERYLHEMMI